MFSQLTPTSTPSMYPVMLQEFCDSATIDDASAVRVAERKLKVAVSLVEQYINHYLITREAVWTLTREADKQFPYNSAYPTANVLPYYANMWGLNNAWIALPRPAAVVSSVVIKTWGSADVTLTQGADYDLDPDSYYPRIRLYQNWYYASAIQITFTSGFGPDESYVPAEVKEAVYTMATCLFFNRGEQAYRLYHEAMEQMLSPWKVYSFGGTSW